MYSTLKNKVSELDFFCWTYNKITHAVDAPSHRRRTADCPVDRLPVPNERGGYPDFLGQRAPKQVDVLSGDRQHCLRAQLVLADQAVFPRLDHRDHRGGDRGHDRLLRPANVLLADGKTRGIQQRQPVARPDIAFGLRRAVTGTRTYRDPTWVLREQHLAVPSCPHQRCALVRVYVLS